MESAPFIRWSPTHLWVLSLVAIIAVTLIITARHLSPHNNTRLCRALALILGSTFIAEHIWNAFTMPHEEWIQHLPLHFCSAMAPVAFIALWWQKRWACAMVYFGVLAASIQALITPTLRVDFPDPRFIIFFWSHSMLALAALLIPLAMRWKARLKDVWRTLLYADLYLLCIIPVNLLLGTNYGFTQHSPVKGCLLDYLGAAPWYYLWLQLPALGLFWLMHLPVRPPALDIPGRKTRP